MSSRDLPSVKSQIPETLQGPSQSMGNWIDVIPLIDPVRDRFDLGNRTGKNDWRMENGELVFHADEKIGKLLFPLVLNGPSLEWEIDFTCTSETWGFSTNFPAKSGVVQVVFRQGTDRRVVRLSGAARFPLKESRQLQTVKRRTLRVRVTREAGEDHVELFVDHQPVGSWRGDREDIAQPTSAGEDDARNERLGLSVQRETDLVFHRIRLRMLEGEVHPLR